MPRRILRVFALAAVVVGAAGGRATSDPAPASALNWVFDGAVQAATRLGDTLYVGGTFTAVAPSANALPPLYALSETTGGVVGPAFPAMDGDVTVVEPDGAGGFFVAGTFTTVGALAQATLAHVLADGTADAAFRPVVTGSIATMARLGPTLYLGGSGLTIAGVFVNLNAGAVSVVDGTRVSWQPATSAVPVVSRLLAADNRIAISGSDGLPMASSGVVAAYDAISGAELWVTLVGPGFVQGPRGSAGQMVRAGARVIVAHSPSSANGGLSNLALATGAVEPSWNPQVAPTALVLAGSTLYLGGSFTTVAGQSRLSLAAIDLTTAALLPWNPGSLTPILRMGAASGGGVFVTGPFNTIGGQPRHRLAQIDAAGAVTPWIADARPDNVYTLAPGPGGTLVVSSSLTAFGSVARSRLAAFDLSTGALLPWAPAADRSVSMIAATAARVTAAGSFTTIDGQPAVGGAALDPATGALLPWAPSPGVGSFADGPSMYWAAGSAPSGPYTLQRYALATGTRDPGWQLALPGSPPTSGVTDGPTLYLATSTGLSAVDDHTARVRWVNPTANVRRLTLSGDTLFTDGGLFNLTTFDTRTGQPIAVYPAPSGLSAMTVADGRVIVNGSDEASLNLTRRPMARRFDGTATAWNPGLRPTLIGGAAETFVVAGDRLVAGGIFGRRTAPALQGLAVFPLEGAVAPAGLRARPKGAATEFTWEPPVTAPTGGYVLEASVTPGQPVFALPLGEVTAFATVVPPGTFYVRVRAVGAASGQDELSNEIAVRGGCSGVPAPPAGLQATIAGAIVTLSWTAPDALVDRYLLDVGTASGLTNLLTATVAGTQTAFASPAPPGTYFVRVRSENACGGSAPSGEVRLTVGATETLPLAPSGLTAAVSGSTVQFAWTPPGGPVSGYVLEAGLEVGLATLGSFAVGATPSLAVVGVPPGVYVVRVRALSGAGSGPPSPDLVVRVP